MLPPGDGAEGPLMLTQLVDCAFGDVAIGDRGEVCFTAVNEEISLYTFRPSTDGRALRPSRRRWRAHRVAKGKSGLGSSGSNEERRLRRRPSV